MIAALQGRHQYVNNSEWSSAYGQCEFKYSLIDGQQVQEVRRQQLKDGMR